VVDVSSRWIDAAINANGIELTIEDIPMLVVLG
jgi:hypothetical protein